MLARLGVPSDKLVLLGNGVDLERFRPTVRPESDSGPGRTSESTQTPSWSGRSAAWSGRRASVSSSRRLSGCATHGRRSSSWWWADPTRARPTPSHPSSWPTPVGRGRIVFAGQPGRHGRRLPGFRPLRAPSHREGFPRSAMEAAASGVPVIATDIRGCRQVVAHGQTGLLVPLHDPRTTCHGNRGTGARPRPPPADGRRWPAQGRGRVRRPSRGLQDAGRLRAGADLRQVPEEAPDALVDHASCRSGPR